MTSNFSVMGMYNYDNTLFANLSVPAAFDNTDKETLVNNLVCELAELEVLYTSPSFMKTIIGVWSVKELPTWERIYAAATAEYNPIENYDRQENSTDTTANTRQHSGNDVNARSGNDVNARTGNDVTAFSGSDVTTNGGTDTTTNSGTDTNTNSGTDTTTNSGSDVTTNGGTDTVTNKVAGFDSNTLVDHDSSTTNHGHTNTLQHGHQQAVLHGHVESLQHGHVEAVQHGHTETLAMGHSETLTHGLTETITHGLTETYTHGEKVVDGGSVTRSSRIHGNIGVTSAQNMLEQELIISPKLNVFNYIIESFKNRFCLLVY